ncbi:MAG TPA: S1 family peptidase [Gemmatimonadales bacterium]|jgi:hypothetical protein
MSRLSTLRLIVPAALVVAAACQDATTPTAPVAARVTPTAYAPQQVQRWFDTMAREGLALPGTVLADYDETTNRAVVGVEHAAAAASVRALAVRLGVPAAALVVREMEPIRFVTTLRDRVVPRIGGIQIHFGNFLCSMGFNAVDGGQASFVTASHCTNRQGGVEGTVYYQPLQSVDGVSIGTEVEDPDYQRNIAGCPHGKKCRHSDASRAAYNPGITSALGQIAKTDATSPNTYSLVLNGSISLSGGDSRDRFTIGETINKVGRTTGWTQGQVTATCATVNVSGSNVSLICQTIVENAVQIVGAGDSGSPVYTSSNALAGVLWGGNSSGTLLVFSPLKNVQDELGPLQVK